MIWCSISSQFHSHVQKRSSELFSMYIWSLLFWVRWLKWSIVLSSFTLIFENIPSSFTRFLPIYLPNLLHYIINVRVILFSDIISATHCMSCCPRILDSPSCSVLSVSTLSRTILIYLHSVFLLIPLKLKLNFIAMHRANIWNTALLRGLLAKWYTFSFLSDYDYAVSCIQMIWFLNNWSLVLIYWWFVFL